jgi:nicotinate phosphoribosyltransferase
VLSDWHEEHSGNLRIILPDTYGTPGFLENAPDWLTQWTGIRIDSGDPAHGGGDRHRLVEIPRRGPREKLVIFSDGLDVDVIEALHAQFSGRVRVSFGWGTLLTNDFRGLVEDDALAPFSLVCKAVAANGRPTVKLSDNPEKAMGPEAEIARYKRVFGVGEQERVGGGGLARSNRSSLLNSPISSLKKFASPLPPGTKTRVERSTS